MKRLLTAMLLSVILAGCGGNSAPHPSSVTVTVTPSQASVPVGGTVNLTGATGFTVAPVVQWSIQESKDMNFNNDCGKLDTQAKDFTGCPYGFVMFHDVSTTPSIAAYYAETVSALLTKSRFLRAESNLRRKMPRYGRRTIHQRRSFTGHQQLWVPDFRCRAIWSVGDSQCGWITAGLRTLHDTRLNDARKYIDNPCTLGIGQRDSNSGHLWSHWLDTVRHDYGSGYGRDHS